MAKQNITEEYLFYHDKYKKKYGENTFVLMQVGSFHEAYATDNMGPNLFKISELLNIVCTRKDKSVSEVSIKYPYLLGVPSHALSKYLKILIDNKFTVVVIDQTTPPPNPLREVTGIYSPSTFIDTVSSESKYLMVIYAEENDSLKSKHTNISVGLTAIDNSTGKVIYYESASTNLVDHELPFEETMRFYNQIRPSELLIYTHSNVKDNNNFLEKFISKLELLPNQIIFKYSKTDPKYFKLAYQNTMLSKIYTSFGIGNTIDNLNLEKYPNAIISLLLATEYIFQHCPNLLKELHIPSYFDDHKFMILGNNAQYQLNIIDYYKWDVIDAKYQSLYDVINNCQTAMGKRKLKQLLCSPYTNKDNIIQSYNMTEKVMTLVNELRSNLKGIYDLEKLFRKVSIQTSHPYELYQIYSSLINLANIIKILFNNSMKDDVYSILNKKYIKELNTVITWLQNTFDIDALSRNNIIEMKENIYNKNIYSDIDKIIDNISNGLNVMDNLAEILSKLSEGNIRVKNNDRDGYYLLTTKKRGLLLKEQLDKQKLVDNKLTDNINITDLEFKELNNDMKISHKHLNYHSSQLEKYYEELHNNLKKYYIKDTTEFYNNNKLLFSNLCYFIQEIDIYVCNAYNAINYHYSKPILEDSDDAFIDAKQMRHPIIERLIDYEYTPHDVKLDNNINGNMIYGPNSAGKSSLMKTAGICLIMSQCGLYVPAESFKYSIFEAIYTRISGNDNIFKGQSSFIVEMNELKTILKRSNKKTLVIGDEICRGTEYLSGTAIVAATIIRLIELNAKFMFATHLHDLPKLDKIKDIKKIKFYYISVEQKGNELIFNRKLQEGTGEEIYGITIAKYILDDPYFVDLAINLKNDLLNQKNINTEFVNSKQSNYNKDIYMDKCSVCGDKTNLESHHINMQKDFKKVNNQIINNDQYHLLKDSQANLAVLCTKCHDDLHNNKININKKVLTSSGVKII